MDSTHKVFGLTLHSNLPIPGLAPVESSRSTADVDIYWGSSPESKDEVPFAAEELSYSSSYTDGAGNPGLRIWKRRDGIYLHLVYYDGIEFWLEKRGTAVWAIWPETSTFDDAVSYFLGPVLGLLLRLRGVTCLHASAVAIDDSCIVFVGPEGAGKSTTAALLARDGFSVISDDVAALVENGDGFRVMPAYPHLCLWPDSVEMLYGSPEALPRFSAGWEKRRLGLGYQGSCFEERELPLRAIYLLGERRPDPAPYIEAVQPRGALLSLLADTFANKILDRESRASEFAVLGRLVTTVAVRRVYAHQEATRFKELCRVIREDYASLHLPKPARS